MRLWLVGAGVIVLLLAGWSAARAMTISSAYSGASASIERLRRISIADPTALTSDTVATARSELRDLQNNLQRLDEATSLPLSESVVADVPWLGERYSATRGLLRIGGLAVDAGMVATDIGEDFVQMTTGQAGATEQGVWLQVLAQHQDSLTRVARDLREIQAIRGSVNADVLPERIGTRLAEVDRVLARKEVQTFIALDVHSALSAIGANGPARYAVLFQNPAELRPSGGFPGTMALVTIEHGQVKSYEFYDVHELSTAYLARRAEPQPEPWAIAHDF
jgi:hypothetical protein